MELLFRQNMNTTIKLTYTRVSGGLGGPAWGTKPEQLSVVEVYWDSIRINIGLI